MTDNSPYSIWVAGYAAVIATFALGWNIWSWLQNKGVLRVTAKLIQDNGDHTLEATPGITTRLLRIDIVNTGKLPITIIAIGGMTKKLKWYHFFRAYPRFQLSDLQPPLPLILPSTETRYWIHEIPGYEYLSRTMKIYIKDSTGKLWFAPRESVNQINVVLSAMRHIAQ